MTTELDQLRREAEMRREAIATDVNLVSDRVVPSRIADRQKARLSQRFGSIRTTVFGSRDSDHSPTSPTTGGNSLSDRASGAVDSIKEAAPDSVAGFAQGNPFAAGLVGLGVGLLAATLIPETREESRLATKVQGHVDDAAAQLAQAGQQVAENVQPAAHDAVEAVRESATESAQKVKADASSAASDVASTAKTEARAAAPSAD